MVDRMLQERIYQGVKNIDWYFDDIRNVINIPEEDEQTVWEAVCILKNALVSLQEYYEDKNPDGEYHVYYSVK